jgi:hypothetical protein
MSILSSSNTSGTLTPFDIPSEVWVHLYICITDAILTYPLLEGERRNGGNHLPPFLIQFRVYFLGAWLMYFRFGSLPSFYGNVTIQAFAVPTVVRD